MKIAIGCDEAAYSLKVEIMKHLDSKGIEYHDFGADKGEIVLYPDVAVKVAEAVAAARMNGESWSAGQGSAWPSRQTKSREFGPLYATIHFPLRGPGRATMPDHVYGRAGYRCRTGQVSGGYLAGV